MGQSHDGESGEKLKKKLGEDFPFQEELKSLEDDSENKKTKTAEFRCRNQVDDLHSIRTEFTYPNITEEEERSILWEFRNCYNGSGGYDNKIKCFGYCSKKCFIDSLVKLEKLKKGERFNKELVYERIKKVMEKYYGFPDEMWTCEKFWKSFESGDTAPENNKGEVQVDVNLGLHSIVGVFILGGKLKDILKGTKFRKYHIGMINVHIVSGMNGKTDCERIYFLVDV